MNDHERANTTLPRKKIHETWQWPARGEGGGGAAKQSGASKTGGMGKEGEQGAWRNCKLSRLFYGLLPWSRPGREMLRPSYGVSVLAKAKATKVTTLLRILVLA